jgi:ribokinase
VLRQADAIVLQLEIPLETVYYTLRFARTNGIRAILNPAPGQPLDLAEVAHADYVIPNETEAEALTGMPVNNIHEARACAVHLLRSGVRRVIVTLGANGALCAGDDRVDHIPPFPVEAVDTTGAGDAFIGSFAVFLAEGLSDREALTRASLYAALSTTQVGTQKSFPAREEFDKERNNRKL